jgi:hypothetical protein
MFIRMHFAWQHVPADTTTARLSWRQMACCSDTHCRTHAYDRTAVVLINSLTVAGASCIWPDEVIAEPGRIGRIDHAG